MAIQLSTGNIPDTSRTRIQCVVTAHQLGQHKQWRTILYCFKNIPYSLLLFSCAGRPLGELLLFCYVLFLLFGRQNWVNFFFSFFLVGFVNTESGDENAKLFFSICRWRRCSRGKLIAIGFTDNRLALDWLLVALRIQPQFPATILCPHSLSFREKRVTSLTRLSHTEI